jgi:hypothetical protein
VGGEGCVPVERAVTHYQDLVRSQSVVGYPATLAEHAPIANGATTPVAAPYEMLVKKTMVDLMILRMIQMCRLLEFVVWGQPLGEMPVVGQWEQLGRLKTPSLFRYVRIFPISLPYASTSTSTAQSYGMCTTPERMACTFTRCSGSVAFR